jgi:hypothetical protein
VLLRRRRRRRRLLRWPLGLHTTCLLALCEQPKTFMAKGP